jgi:cytochrome c
MNRKNTVAIVLAAAAVCIGLNAQAQDAAAGKAVFAQCASCHTTDGSPLVGPSLQGIAGRASGSFGGFRYSRALKSANITWDDAHLDAFIANPQTVVPGNVMPFSGIADAKQRTNLIAYLKTLK